MDEDERSNRIGSRGRERGSGWERGRRGLGVGGRSLYCYNIIEGFGRDFWEWFGRLGEMGLRCWFLLVFWGIICKMDPK